jgi:putative alpha-1,2-mannosidase
LAFLSILVLAEESDARSRTNHYNVAWFRRVGLVADGVGHAEERAWDIQSLFVSFLSCRPLLTVISAVADVDGENTGGFSTDGSNITGFSALHDSGTGGNPSLGNFPIFPQICPSEDINTCKFPIAARATHYKNDSVVAKPGYFGVTLENGIKADMTVSKHAALYRFDFSGSTQGNGSTDAVISLDLTDLWASRQNASISVEAEDGGKSGRMKGNGTFLPSFGAGSYIAYFCLDVTGAAIKDSGVWVNDRAGTEPKNLYVTRGFNLFYLQAGGFVRFKGPLTGPIAARMGISFISTAQACKNAEEEIPGSDFDFDGLVKSAQDAWRKQLAPVTIESGGVDNSLLVSFWSAVYRTMISPQDYSGENPHWTSEEPYFDSFYCIWVCCTYTPMNTRHILTLHF